MTERGVGPWPERGREPILLSDDDGDIRKAVAELLRFAGYTVIEAVEGRDGYDKFTENQNALYLPILDVVVPGEKGNETYQPIREVCGI